MIIGGLKVFLGRVLHIFVVSFSPPLIETAFVIDI